MAFTTAQLTALEAAIASGTLEVQYSDKQVKYRSLRDMIALRDLMRKELELAAPSKRLEMEFDKGAS